MSADNFDDPLRNGWPGSEVSSSDPLASRLRQLKPLSPDSLQARFYYDAGYRASELQFASRQRIAGGALAVSWRSFALLVAACLLVAVGSGVLASRLFPTPPSATISKVGGQRDVDDSPKLYASEPRGSALTTSSVVSVDPPTDQFAIRSGVPLGQFLAACVGAWVQPMSFHHRDVEIGPVGADWEQLVVTRAPPVEATIVDQSPPADSGYPIELVPYSLMPKRPDLSPFRRVFWN